MLVGVIADDFTGASDIANTLAKGIAPEGGLTTAQFSGIPKQRAAQNIDAGVISLKSRSAPVADAIAQSCQALDWLLTQGCQQIVFKYCSTFDSTPEGNIGPVGEALAKSLDVKAVVVCPAFPATGRTVFQGHLFVFDKLLNESGMEQHPLTPMTDADIRRCLTKQCQGSVGHVAHSVIREGSSAVRTALRKNSEDDQLFCVVDATTEDDLLIIGEAVNDAPLVTGGSGVAMGLPRNFFRQGLTQSKKIEFESIAGRAAILAGSCSSATRQQIENHAQSYPTFAIDVARVLSDEVGPEYLLDFFNKHADSYPLAYSSASPEEVSEIQKRFGRDVVAAKLDNLFAETACLLLELDVDRIVVAGGETSGAVAQAVTETLSVEAMHIGPEVDPGVPILRVGKDKVVALALKSGNFGAIDFFAKALAIMAGSR